MQAVTHELLHGSKNLADLLLESFFHVPTRLNICGGSQIECGSSAESTIPLSVAPIKERKTEYSA